MHRTFQKFALRAGFITAKRNANRGIGLSVAALVLCASLAGCAENPNYPSVATISDLGNVLTPEERQKAVQDLQKDQARTSEPVKTASR